MKIRDISVLSEGLRAGIFPQHPDDASFETAKGSSAVEGDIYWNITLKSFVGYDGSGFVAVSHIIDKTYTVGSGKDFTTLSDALDFVKKIPLFRVKLVVDPGEYVGDILLDNDFQGDIEFEGDTRTLAGVSLIDGITPRSDAVEAGSGVISLSSVGGTLTVTGATTNPDFSGWELGDKVLIGSNTGITAFYNIVSATGNVIVVDNSIQPVGDRGSFVTLVPNRRITGQLTVSGGNVSPRFHGFELFHGVSTGITLNQDARYLELEKFVTSSMTIPIGVYSLIVASAMGRVECVGKSCMFSGTGNGIVVYGGILNCDYCVSSGALHASFKSYSNGYVSAIGAVALLGPKGFWAIGNGFVLANDAIAIKLTEGFRSDENGSVECVDSFAYDCTYGYLAFKNGIVRANGSSPIGCSTNYTPASAYTEGNYGGWIFR